MSEQTETMLKNIREGMAMDGQAPHALTREEVITEQDLTDMAQAFGYDMRWAGFCAKVKALRLALAQQAQEIERLEGVCLDRLRSGQRLADENILLRQSLASMTAERDEACGELLVSLDDAPIGSLAGKLVTANRVLRSHLATLQATLAEREERINELEADRSIKTR